MKIIDLLNRIANNEALPERIRYDNNEWKLGTSENDEIDYLKNDYAELFNQYLEDSLIESLNEKIEILKVEEKDIQGIEELEFTEECVKEPGESGVGKLKYKSVSQNEMQHKINEIIRTVNKMLLDKNN